MLNRKPALFKFGATGCTPAGGGCPQEKQHLLVSQLGNICFYVLHIKATLSKFGATGRAPGGFCSTKIVPST